MSFWFKHKNYIKLLYESKFFNRRTDELLHNMYIKSKKDIIVLRRMTKLIILFDNSIYIYIINILY